MRNFCTVFFLLAPLLAGIPLVHGAHGRVRGSTSDGLPRRHLKDNQVPATPRPTPAPTPVPTESPTLSPSLAPSELPSSPPSVARTSAPTTSSDQSPSSSTPVGTPTEAPTDSLPENYRSLLSFAITVDGSLDDESAFQEDLEAFMFADMSSTLVSLLEVSLVEAPYSQSRRSLQDSTLLRYQGTVVLDPEFHNVTTDSDVQQVQVDTLEGESLAEWFLWNASQPVTVLAVQVADRDAVGFEQDDDSRFVPVPNSKDKKGGLIAGILVAVVVVLAAVGFFVWREFEKPPPPPPYEFNEASESEDFGDAEELNKNLQVSLNKTMSESDGIASPQSLKVTSPNTATPPRHNLALVRSEDGMEVVRNENPYPRSVDYDSESKDMDVDEDRYGDGEHTVGSNDDSMAGYSLATDGPYNATTTLQRPVESKPAPQPKPVVTSATLRQNAALAMASRAIPENSVQKRWFMSSDTEKASDEADIHSRSSSQLPDASPSDKSSEVFEDLDDSDVGSEDASETYASSAREDYSTRASMGSLQVSDNDTADSGYIPHIKSPGALGYFEREHEDDYMDDYDVLPQINVTRGFDVPDNLSEVPSDERHNDRLAEQDLSGFAKAQLIHKGLDRLPSPDRPTSNGGFNLTTSGGSWDNNPELADDWVKEQRRVKRETRNRREDRKQPPLTMEV